MHEKYLIFDESYNYAYRDDRLKVARALGFTCISEATVKLYQKYRSSKIVGDMVGVTNDAIRYELKRFGHPLRPRGSFKGEKRPRKK